MPINFKTVAVASASVAVIGGIVYVHGIHRSLYEDFPELNRKVVRKAFRKVCMNAMLGQYPNQESDAEYRQLFLEEVAAISDPLA
jgi:hypothetical protein